MLRYVTTALGYVDAVVAAVEQGLSYGRMLDAQLERVEATAVDAQSSLTTSGAAASYELLALVEQLYDDCAALAVGTASVLGPKLITHSVPSMTHIAVLATRLYGSDGLSRIDEILANNPGAIPNPAAIEAGTLLRVAPRTVTS